MRIDLTDLERLDGFAEALGRLFWCLVVIAFGAAILGSPGTGLLLLVLGAAAFVVRVALEDFTRSRRDRKKRNDRADRSDREQEPSITVHRARRTRAAARRPKSAV